MQPMTRYIEAIGLDPGEEATSHLYEKLDDGMLRPMCAMGWNRSYGFGFSIFLRVSGRSLCRICEMRANKGLHGVDPKQRRMERI